MASKEPPTIPAHKRVQNSYKQLTEAAAQLNTASDGLKEAVGTFELALQRLNLGVSAWVRITGNEDDETGAWWARRIGFVKIAKAWCIALSDESGNYHCPERDSEEKWAFNEAPRWMRIEAISKLPELLDALLKQAEETTEKLKKKTEQVFDLSIAMSAALDEIDAKAKGGANA